MGDMSTPAFTVDEVISKYLDLREQIEKIEADHKAKTAPLKSAMEGIEKYLLALSNKTGQTQFGTERGTAFLSTVTACKVSDWEATKKYIQDHGAFHLLNKAVNKTAVGEFIEQHAVPPPGVEWVKMREIKVRSKKSGNEKVEME